MFAKVAEGFCTHIDGLVRSPVGATCVCVYFLFLWRDSCFYPCQWRDFFYFEETFFLFGATFFHSARLFFIQGDFFLLGATFLFGATFFLFGATFFIRRDFSSLARLFFIWRDFFYSARLFYYGATFCCCSFSYRGLKHLFEAVFQQHGRDCSGS